jgi:hypothetical protein
MRGNDLQQAEMWSYVSPEERVPHDHPLRPLRAMTDEALRQLHLAPTTYVDLRLASVFSF